MVFFCILIGLIKSTVGQSSYYNSCFDQIRKADDNENLLLSMEEYNKLLITVSGGAILLQNETPPVLSNPYSLRQNADTQQLNIRGINAVSTVDEQSEMESFCQQIYSGLASILGIKIEVKACTGAFRMADSNPQDDVLSSKEYAFFVVNVSKDVSLINSSFEELPDTIKDVFDDMSVDSGISATLGDEYLVQFCERTAIAARIGEVVYETMPTETPSKAPISRESVSTNRPTSTTTAPISLSEGHIKCKTDLIVSDRNRNSLLDADEFGNFLEELSDQRVSAANFVNLDIIFQNAYENLTNSNEVTIDIGGFRPGLTPSKDEYENLIRICNQTYTALDKYEKEALDAPAFHPSLSPAVDVNSTQLSEIELRTCKKFMVLSDSNRNSILEETEFIAFVSRMTTTQDFSGNEFDDLDVSFRAIYDGKTSAVGGIDIDGSKPGQESTPTQENLFRKLCTEVTGAIEELEANAPTTKGPIVQSTPSQAPSSTDVEISDEFFRVCKTAMLIADRNRNDVLEAEEYVRFLNRLTISEFSGEVFADLEPTLQQGFLRVSMDGKVNVYGSKPGTTPSDEENIHLRHVCESVHIAIEGYHGGNNTTSTGSPKSDCETKLWNADRNFDNALDQSEYVAYLRSITGINYTKFDALPYLLKDQYDWFRLGEDTVNIAGLANNSIPLQGDKVRIAWICDRASKSIELVSKIGREDKLTSYCDAALRHADNNTDGFLDDDEFISLVNAFTAMEQPLYNLSAVDAFFLKSYYRFKDAELNVVDLKVAKSNGLCEGVANATSGSRERETLFRICKDSLKLSDIDRNGRLNQTEYVPFIDTLVTAYNLTISASGDYEGLKSSSAGIDINGLYAESSIEAILSLREVCLETGYAFGIIQHTDVEIVTIYNSFVISNEAGLKAEHLTPDSSERIGLDKAYAAFVDYEVQAISESHGRFLIVRSAKLYESDVYQIVDGACPNGNKTDEYCQTAFGSFNITVSSDDESSNIIGDLLSNNTQNAIDRGAMQLMLSTIDPNNTLTIMKSSKPVKPAVDEGDELETTDEPIETESKTPNKGKNFASLTGIVGTAIGASVVGAALFFLFVSRQKKHKSSINDEKEVMEVEEMNNGKPPFHFDDTILEEGRNRAVNRFVFSSQHIEDDCTCGLSETNDSSFQNVSQKLFSAFKIEDRNEVGALSLSDNSYVNTKAEFQINDESDSSLDTEEVTCETFEVRVDDKCEYDVQHFPPNPFSTAPIIAAPSTSFAQNAVDVSDDDVAGKDDESDSFEEYEIESDDEIEELDLVQLCPESTAPKDHSKNNQTIKVEEIFDFDESFSIEEYEDASDEEIETSVHDDEDEGEMKSEEQKIQDEIEEHYADISNDEQTGLRLKENGNEIVPNSNHSKGDVNVREKNAHDDSGRFEQSPAAGGLDEISQDDSCAQVDESEVEESDTEEEASRSDTEEEASENDENSNSDDESQISGIEEHDDVSTNSDNAEAVTRSYQKYRPVIEELIRQVMPDELDNIDVMMEQFIGNEKELVTSLRNMAGIDNSDDVDDESGSDDSVTNSDDSDVKPIAKVETSTSEEEESEDEDDDVKPIAKVETSMSEEEESEDDDDDDEEEEESESQESNTSKEELSEESEEDEEEDDEEEDEEEEDDEEEDSESSEEEPRAKVKVSQPESDESEEDDDSSEYESD